MKVDAFSYPQEDFLKELRTSQAKVQIMESTLADFFEEFLLEDLITEEGVPTSNSRDGDIPDFEATGNND